MSRWWVLPVGVLIGSGATVLGFWLRAWLCG